MDKQGTFVTLNIVVTLKRNRKLRNESVFYGSGTDFIGFMNKSLDEEKRISKISNKANKESCILKYGSQDYKNNIILANKFNAKV